MRLLEWNCGGEKKLKVGSAREVLKRAPDRVHSIIYLSAYPKKRKDKVLYLQKE